MTRIAVDHLLALLNAAFDGGGAQALMANIGDVRAADWDWRPPTGDRTIREIVEHAAIAKHLHTEHLFGAATHSYADIYAESPLRERPGDTAALVAWARAGHAAFAAGVAWLDDPDLDAPTRRHYGAVQTKAAVIGVMIQHDCYHAGEINHLRALRQTDDAWWPGLMAEQPSD